MRETEAVRGSVIRSLQYFDFTGEENPTAWLQNFPVSGLIPITEVPVKISSGFQGKRTNLITIVHLVVIS